MADLGVWQIQYVGKRDSVAMLHFLLDGYQLHAAASEFLRRQRRLANGGDLDAEVGPVKTVVDHNAVLASSGKAVLHQRGYELIEIDPTDIGCSCRPFW